MIGRTKTGWKRNKYEKDWTSYKDEFGNFITAEKIGGWWMTHTHKRTDTGLELDSLYFRGTQHFKKRNDAERVLRRMMQKRGRLF